MNEDILNKLDAYIREKCEIEDDPDYDLDANLFDLGFLDSVGGTEVLLYLEEEFGIEITQKDVVMYPMNTVREIAKVASDKVR